MKLSLKWLILTLCLGISVTGAHAQNFTNTIRFKKDLNTIKGKCGSLESCIKQVRQPIQTLHRSLQAIHKTQKVLKMIRSTLKTTITLLQGCQSAPKVGPACKKALAALKPIEPPVSSAYFQVKSVDIKLTPIRNTTRLLNRYLKAVDKKLVQAQKLSGAIHSTVDTAHKCIASMRSSNEKRGLAQKLELASRNGDKPAPYAIQILGAAYQPCKGLASPVLKHFMQMLKPFDLFLKQIQPWESSLNKLYGYARAIERELNRKVTVVVKVKRRVKEFYKARKRVKVWKGSFWKRVWKNITKSRWVWKLVDVFEERTVRDLINSTSGIHRIVDKYILSNAKKALGQLGLKLSPFKLPIPKFLKTLPSSASQLGSFSGTIQRVLNSPQAAFAQIYLRSLPYLRNIQLQLSNTNRLCKDQKQVQSSSGRVGQLCMSGGRCGHRAWCNRRDNRCYEVCYGTALRGGNFIPRKNIYYCNYGSEKPSYMTASHHTRRVGKTCRSHSDCQPYAWCHVNLDKRCYELCYSTNKIGANRIPRKNRYYCDYRNEKPNRR